GKFFVIYADPPWAFDNSGFEQSAESQYPTMTTDELCNHCDIAELVGEQGVLFLWVPNSMIGDGLKVCEAWGLEYKTNRTWIKDRSPGIGWYVKSKHETLLIATRGQGVFPKEKPDSWFKAEVQGHSRKPDCVYTDIEAMYPGPYIELFARRPRNGWTSWGNEIREPEAT
ncbi:MAG: MT-A70 family methyltransferase, partial [Nitrospirales bacterium]